MCKHKGQSDDLLRSLLAQITNEAKLKLGSKGKVSLQGVKKSPLTLLPFNINTHLYSEVPDF